MRLLRFYLALLCLIFDQGRAYSAPTNDRPVGATKACLEALLYADHSISTKQRDEQRRDEAWATLRNGNMLVNQHSVHSEVGLCGSACTINAAQAALAVSGNDSFINPQDLFSNLARSDIGKNGMGLESIMREVVGLLEKKVPKEDVIIRAVAMPRVIKDVPASIPQAVITRSDLMPSGREIKIVLGGELNDDGIIVVPHGKIIRKFVDGKAYAVDPTGPNNDLIMEPWGFSSINGFDVPAYQYVGNVRLDGIKGFAPFAVITVEVRSKDQR